MTYNATVVNVVIASPGDVPAERDVVESVVHRWNTMFSQSQGVVLVPRRWETSAAAEMGASAQSIINRQMIADGDILIGVFWTRLGTPTENHASGTAEEIEEFLANGRAASLFFSSMPAMLGNVDSGQWQALITFREAMSQRGLIRTFESHSELSDAVLMSINHYVQQIDFSDQASERPPPQLRDVDPAADVRPSFVSLGGGRATLALTNYGSAPARDVTVATQGVSDAERCWDVIGGDEAVPVLASGSSIDLPVALDFDSPSRVAATVSWVNPDGSTGSSVDTLAM